MFVRESPYRSVTISIKKFKFFHFHCICNLISIDLLSIQGENFEEEPVTFFDPKSPHFLTTMYVTLAALGVCLCFGLLYQALFYKRRHPPGNSKYSLSEKNCFGLNPTDVFRAFGTRGCRLLNNTMHCLVLLSTRSFWYRTLFD